MRGIFSTREEVKSAASSRPRRSVGGTEPATLQPRSPRTHVRILLGVAPEVLQSKEPGPVPYLAWRDAGLDPLLLKVGQDIYAAAVAVTGDTFGFPTTFPVLFQQPGHLAAVAPRSQSSSSTPANSQSSCSPGTSLSRDSV